MMEMEPAIVLVLGVVAAILIGSILGIVAYAKSRQLAEMVDRLSRQISAIERRLDGRTPAVPTEAATATPRPRPVVTPGPLAAAAPPQASPLRPQVTAPPIAPKVEPPAASVSAGDAAADRMAAALHRMAASGDAGAIPTRTAPPAAAPEPLLPPLSQLSQVIPSFTWAQLEEKAGKLWMAAAGVLVLFLSAGFFAKYAIERGWLGPAARVCLGVAAGLVVLVLGEGALKRKMRPLGQALIGGGIAILYVSIYAAHGLYHLLPEQVAFGLLVCVTAAGIALAVAHDAVLISVLAIIGGFVTPVLISTGVDRRDALFAYVILLDVGVLAAAYLKGWRGIDTLAFLGTSSLFTGWYAKFYQPAMATPALAWISAFYVLFLVIPFVGHYRRRTHIAVERFLLALANAVFLFGYAYLILHGAHPKALAFVSGSMSLVYLAFELVTRVRIPDDEDAIFGFVTLATVFATLVPPLAWSADATTLCWAAEAPALLYLGYRYKYLATRAFGALMIPVAVVHFFVKNWPSYGAGASTLFYNKDFATAIALSIAIGAFAVVGRLRKAEGTVLDRFATSAAGILAGYLSLLFTAEEFWDQFGFRSTPVSCEDITSALAAVWALSFIAVGVVLRSRVARVAGFLPMLAGILFAVVGLVGVGGRAPYPMFINLQFAACVASLLPLVGYCIAPRFLPIEGAQGKKANVAAGIAAGLGLLIVAQMELCKWLDTQALMSIAPQSSSFLWALGAFGFLAAGVYWRSAASRLTGLVPAAAAAVLAVLPYLNEGPSPGIPVFSGRFGAGLAAAAAVFAYALVFRYSSVELSAQERDSRQLIAGIGAVGLLALFSAEPFQYFHDHVTPVEKARWLAQMSLSVVWGVYAVLMLSLGFWRRWRPVRLAALLLFAITCAKLVFVDIANIQQIWRILAFLVLGLLMIGASYMYYRFEKQLEDYFAGQK